jgi:hypothetical protein
VSDLIAELDSGASDGDKLPPAPQGAKLKEAEEAIKKEYRRLYSRADVQSYQKELAAKLMAAAGNEADDEVKRFVMFREARDLAATAGDLRMATAAIEKMAGFYEVDLLKMKIEMLRKAAAGAKGPQQYRDVVLLCLNLADEARRTRRTSDAKEALAIAAEAARNSKSRALIQQAAEAEEKLGSRRR